MSPFRLLLLSSAALTAACAQIPADRGIGDVQSLVTERGGPDFHKPDQGDAAAESAFVRQTLAAPLSVDDALRVALLRNPEMQAVYARLGLAQADVVEAGRLSNPTLSLAALTPTNTDQRLRLDYGLAENFTDLLFLHLRTRIAEGELERAKELAGRRIQQLAADVSSAYYRLVAAGQVEQMRTVTARAAAASAGLARRMFDAGNIPELNLRQEQAAATQAQLAADAASAQVQILRSDLNRLMGLRAVEMTWQAAAKLPLPVKVEDDDAKLHELALAHRLDLAAKHREIKVLTDVQELAERYRWLGIVDVGVQGERDDDGTHLIGPSVSLQLPIFNQGQGGLLRARAQIEQAQAELTALETEIGNAVTRAHDELQAARQRAERYRVELIPQRESIVRRTQELQNFMIVGQFELIAAKQQEYDGYQGYLEALRDYWLARVELARVIGSRLPSDATMGEPNTGAIELPEQPAQTTHDMGSMPMP